MGVVVSVVTGVGVVVLGRLVVSGGVCVGVVVSVVTGVGVVLGRLVVSVGVDVVTGVVNSVGASVVDGGIVLVIPQHVVWHAACTSSQSQTPTAKNAAQLVLASAASGWHPVVVVQVDVVDVEAVVDGAEVGGSVSSDRQQVDPHPTCTDSQAQSPRS